MLSDGAMSNYAVVWVDQHEAKVFHLQFPEADTAVTLAGPNQHLHHTHQKGAEGSKAHDEATKHFFSQVATALRGVSEVLIVGPSQAKLHLLRYLHTHERSVERHVVGVETVDHPTDPQLLAYARKAFTRLDAAPGATPSN
jgi:stalled ribosome rescue protein Dom34